MIYYRNFYFFCFIFLFLAKPASSQLDIHIQSRNDVETKRHQLIQYIWGGALPSHDSTISTYPDIALSYYDYLKTSEGNLDRIDSMVVRLPYGLSSEIFLFHPIKSNKNLFIYHAGHNLGFIKEDEANGLRRIPGTRCVIPKLIERGYTVMAVNMPPCGRKSININGISINLDMSGHSHDTLFELLDQPFRLFFEPLTIALNHIDKTYDFHQYFMTGLSGGGWMSTVYPALDPRISFSFPVAGSMPKAFKTQRDIGDEEQEDSSFYAIASYPDLYLMAAVGDKKRFHLQTLNKNDDCCFADNGSRWKDQIKQYANQMNGSYDFYYDELAPYHQISEQALEQIISYADQLTIDYVLTDVFNFVTVFPNPVSTHFNLEVPYIKKDLDISFTHIFINSGKKHILPHQMNEKGNYMINTSVLQKGINFIAVNIEGQQKIFKIIKQ